MQLVEIAAYVPRMLQQSQVSWFSQSFTNATPTPQEARQEDKEAVHSLLRLLYQSSGEDGRAEHEGGHGGATKNTGLDHNGYRPQRLRTWRQDPSPPIQSSPGMLGNRSCRPLKDLCHGLKPTECRPQE